MVGDMDSHEAALLLLAKMALADGESDDEERQYLGSLVPDRDELDALLERAKEFELRALVSPMTHYPDRFVVAMRLAVMATINLDLDKRERALFDEVVELMELTDEDHRLIKEEAASLATDEVREKIHPRVAELRAESSLSPGKSAVWPWP